VTSDKHASAGSAIDITTLTSANSLQALGLST